MLHGTSELDRFFGMTHATKMNMRFGTWNVSHLFREDLLKMAARKSVTYKLDLVAVQEVRWDEGGSQPADKYTFFYVNGNTTCKLHHILLQ